MLTFFYGRLFVDYRQQVVFLDLITFLYFNFFDRAAAGGKYRRFHLHGFDDQDFFVFFNGFTDFKIELNDFALTWPVSSAP